METQKIIFYSIGGLGIFLYGMTLLSDGLQRLAGPRMRNIIRAFTSNPLKGMLVGAGVTSVIQSSSITTVMLVGLLNAGVMSLQQSVGVIYGANIGTTITAQIIAFKVTKYALPMIAIGFIMFRVLSKRSLNLIGQSFIALGLIFLGLKFMKEAFAFLKHSDEAIQFCASLSHHPVLAIIVGVILTVIVQSSSASIGITIAMASTGLIDITAALYLLLGDNIGTTITAWLASIGSCVAARQMALVHSLFNITGAAYFGLLISSGFYVQFVDWLTPGDITPDTIARNIANAHSAFNILNAIILLPIIRLLSWIAIKTFKAEEDVVSPDAKFLDDHLLDTPEIAIEQVGKELHHMSTLSLQSFNLASESFINNDLKKAKEVVKIEDAVDSLQQEITRYLVKIFSRPLSADLSNRLPSLLHSVNDMEKVSDHAESMAQLTLKRKESNYPISEAAIKEIEAIYQQTRSMFQNTVELLNSGSLDLAEKILSEEDKIDELKKQNLNQHIARLKKKECHPLAGLGFVAFLNHAEKIGDHLTNITNAAVSHYTYDSGIKEDLPKNNS